MDLYAAFETAMRIAKDLSEMMSLGTEADARGIVEDAENAVIGLYYAEAEREVMTEQAADSAVCPHCEEREQIEC